MTEDAPQPRFRVGQEVYVIKSDEMGIVRTIVLSGQEPIYEVQAYRLQRLRESELSPDLQSAAEVVALAAQQRYTSDVAKAARIRDKALQRAAHLRDRAFDKASPVIE